MDLRDQANDPFVVRPGEFRQSFLGKRQADFRRFFRDRHWDRLTGTAFLDPIFPDLVRVLHVDAGRSVNVTPRPLNDREELLVNGVFRGLDRHDWGTGTVIFARNRFPGLRRQFVEIDRVRVAEFVLEQPQTSVILLEFAIPACSDPQRSLFFRHRSTQHAAVFRTLEVDPVILKSDDIAVFVRMAIRAAGVPHHLANAVDGFLPPDEERSGLRVVPRAKIETVRVDPSKEKLFFLPRQKVLVRRVVKEPFRQRRRSGTVRVRIEDLCGPVRRRIRAADRGDQVDMVHFLSPGNEVLVTDVEKLRRRSGKIQPPGDPFVTAMTADTFPVENRLDHRRIVHITASPRFILRHYRRTFCRHFQRPSLSRRRTVLMAAGTASRSPRSRLDERAHRANETVILIQKLEIDRASGRCGKTDASVFADRHDAVVDLRCPGQSRGR